MGGAARRPQALAAVRRRRVVPSPATVADRRGFTPGRGDDLRGPGRRRARRRPAPAGQVARRTPAQVRLGRAARGAPPRDRRGAGRRRRRWSSGTPAAPARVESSVADPRVTEVSAGSGLLVPGPLRPLPGLRAAARRRSSASRWCAAPSAGLATVAGGGFIASGPPAGPLPLPWAPPGLHLTGLEGAGEVQTPLTGTRRAPAADRRPVWFRHAKSGELAEHTNTVHLLAGDRIVETVPTYRGLGLAFGESVVGPPCWTSLRQPPPTLGAGRLVCIDGPAGSGKTTLAAAVADARRAGARVVHMDDLYEGWSGLPARRRPARRRCCARWPRAAGCYRRYDWLARRVRRDRRRGARAAARARGRRQRCRPVRRPASRCWSGSRRRPTCGCARASSATATRSGRTGSTGRPRGRPVRARAHERAGRPRSRRQSALRVGRALAGPALTGSRPLVEPERPGRVLRVHVECRPVVAGSAVAAPARCPAAQRPGPGDDEPERADLGDVRLLDAVTSVIASNSLTST